MSGKFLLDTNIIIGIFANDDSILTSLAEAEEVFVPIVAPGELYYGAYRSRNQRQKIKLNQSLFFEISFKSHTHKNLQIWSPQ